MFQVGMQSAQYCDNVPVLETPVWLQFNVRQVRSFIEHPGQKSWLHYKKHSTVRPRPGREIAAPCGEKVKGARTVICGSGAAVHRPLRPDSAVRGEIQKV